jgi:hypothetical protein
MADTSLRMYGVLSHAVDSVWDDVLPYLQATLDMGGNKFSVDFIKRGIENRNMQLWVSYSDSGFQMFGITEIVNYENKKACRMLWGGGIMYDSYAAHVGIIEQWAKDNGCHSIELHGRMGWNKVLADNGFKPIHYVAEKQL